MEENNLKSFFNTFVYLCKDFSYNYNEILITFNIILSYLKGDAKELIDFFILDLTNINDYLNKKTNKFDVPIPDKFKSIEHYLNLYHNFLIKINWHCDKNDKNISQNNKYFKDYLEFIEMSSDILYYYNILDHNKIALILLIYIPLYTAYII